MYQPAVGPEPVRRVLDRKAMTLAKAVRENLSLPNEIFHKYRVETVIPPEHMFETAGRDETETLKCTQPILTIFLRIYFSIGRSK